MTMDPKFKTSFIPKQEVIATSGRGPVGYRYSVFAVIAITAFVVSLVLAVGVFFFQKSLVKKVEEMNVKLVAYKESFEPNFIQELIDTDRRVEAAKELINKHNVISPLFTLLESKTLEGVRFTSLDFSIEPNGQPSVSLNGEALGFFAIALQSDEFAAEPKIKNPLFSGLDLDEKGNAKFNFKSSLDGEAFLYKNTFSPPTETLEEEAQDGAGLEDIIQGGD